MIQKLLKKTLLLLVMTTLFSSGMVSARQPSTAPRVRVMTIEEQNVVPASEYVGHVEAIQTVELRARVEGFLEEVSFTEGDRVREGQVLYRIETDGYAARVAMEKARVAMEKARVAQAEAELTRAKSHLKRMRSVNPQSISALDLDNAVAAELAARANLSAASANLSAARAALDDSRLNLAYTSITAPITGRIGRTAYTRGNLVNPAAGVLATIVQTAPVRVAYAVSENDIPAVQKAIQEMDTGGGAELLSPRLILPGDHLYPETGQVVFVDNRVDRATGTITVRARFDNAGRLLLPGQYVTVQVRAAAPKRMPVVPQSAVLVNQDGRYVLTVKDGIAAPQSIVTGTALDRMWAVESGLSAGDQVIVSGIQKVQPGQPVTVIPADPEN